MLIPITRCLVATVFILGLPQPAAAIFDPRYNCTTLNDETEILVDGKPVELRRGTKVKLTFWHTGYGFFPVDIELPDGLFITAHNGIVVGDLENLPNDKVLRRAGTFLWVHSQSEISENPIEIELDCGTPS